MSKRSAPAKRCRNSTQAAKNMTRPRATPAPKPKAKLPSQPKPKTKARTQPKPKVKAPSQPEPEPIQVAPQEKPLRPAQCRAFLRRKLAERFPQIVEGFVNGAQSGSCQHIKLATEFLDSKPKVKKEKAGRRGLQAWLDELEAGSGAKTDL